MLPPHVIVAAHLRALARTRLENRRLGVRRQCDNARRIVRPLILEQRAGCATTSAASAVRCPVEFALRLSRGRGITPDALRRFDGRQTRARHRNGAQRIEVLDASTSHQRQRSPRRSIRDGLPTMS